MKRILIAAIVGGIILFVWSAIAHMFTPLGEMGMSTLPNEDGVRASLQQSISRAGFYIFPAPDPNNPNDMKALQTKMTTGPVGILVYTPGGPLNMPRLLLIELATNILAALIAAIIASALVGSYGRRVALITLLAVFASVSLSLSYWNWYNFPAAFVLGELVTEVIGLFLAALFIAKVVPRPA